MSLRPVELLIVLRATVAIPFYARGLFLFVFSPCWCARAPTHTDKPPRQQRGSSSSSTTGNVRGSLRSALATVVRRRRRGGGGSSRLCPTVMLPADHVATNSGEHTTLALRSPAYARVIPLADHPWGGTTPPLLSPSPLAPLPDPPLPPRSRESGVHDAYVTTDDAVVCRRLKRRIDCVCVCVRPVVAFRALGTPRHERLLREPLSRSRTTATTIAIDGALPLKCHHRRR